MSRSFKKHYYDSYCSCKGDKDYRAFYNRNYRAKKHRLLKQAEQEFMATNDIETSENGFYNNRIDYSLRFADKWSWPSDGAASYFGSIQTIQADFDKDVFGQDYSWCHRHKTTIWDKYNQNRWVLCKKIKGHLYKWDWFDGLFLEGKIPLNFATTSQLIDWLRIHQQDIVEYTYNRCIRK